MRYDGVCLWLKNQPGAKTWVAFVTGRSRKFGLAREFVAAAVCHGDERGYLPECEGIHEICEAGERPFALIVGDTLAPMTRDEVLAHIKAEEQKKKAMQEEIDQRIARINSEGGFTLN